MTRRLPPSLPLLLACGLPSCGLLGMSDDDRGALARYQANAQLYYDGGNFDQALDQARRGLDIAPDDYKLHCLRGWCLLRLVPRDPAMLARATEQFERVMAYRSPDEHGPQALLGYGLCHQRLAQERLEQAQALRDELARVKFDPGEANVRSAQIETHENVARGHLEIAGSQFQRLIDRGDALLEAHRNMMQTLALAQKYAPAVEHGNRFLQRCEQEQDRLKKELERTVVVAYERHVHGELDRLVDQEIEVRGFLANLFYKLGQHAQAVEQLDQILAEDPTRSTDYYNRARSLEALGRGQEAVRDYERFLATSKLPQGNERVAAALKSLHELAGR
jgi:tetratricopeptide (TPR) repeat protein